MDIIVGLSGGLSSPRPVRLINKTNFGNVETGPFESNDPSEFSQQESKTDPLTRGRHVWRKGRFEDMGGPILYTQGHGVEDYENNQRQCQYSPFGYSRDPVANELELDYQE